MTLREKTILLKQQLLQLKSRFFKNDPPESIKDRTFFKQMKEETKSIFQLLNEWESETLTFLQNKQSTLYPQQIEATSENMQMIILHSYYIDVRKRIYMEYFKSTIYVFDQLLSELANEIGEV